jgi:hypothetical protein
MIMAEAMDLLPNKQIHSRRSSVNITIHLFRTIHRLDVLGILLCLSCLASMILPTIVRTDNSMYDVKKFYDILKQGNLTNINSIKRSNEYYIGRDVIEHSIAIIVAYRVDGYNFQNRSDHLERFVPHMVQFLEKCVSHKRIKDYYIYVIEQTDDGKKFNRGMLMNVGFEYSNNAGRNHDIFIFHDVDLLPHDDLIDLYTTYPTRPIHLAHNWPKYSYIKEKVFIGGVTSFSVADFRTVNGVR